jgi:hypothetical protein
LEEQHQQKEGADPCLLDKRFFIFFTLSSIVQCSNENVSFFGIFPWGISCIGDGSFS